jgi:hypothetical protein
MKNMAGKMSAAGVLAPRLMVLLLLVHYTGVAHAEVGRKLLEGKSSRSSALPSHFEWDS